MNTAIAIQLESLPDLEPPAGGWRRIERRVSIARWRRRARHALAASVLLACAALLATVDWRSPVATESTVVQPFIVSAPATQNVEPVAADPELLALQARSRDMERYLQGLSREVRITSADQAGVIAELEDRIAAVDYQLNRAAFEPARTPAPAPDLWRQRVEYMDQLVRAHYVESGVTGF